MKICRIETTDDNPRETNFEILKHEILKHALNPPKYSSTERLAGLTKIHILLPYA